MGGSGRRLQLQSALQYSLSRRISGRRCILVRPFPMYEFKVRRCSRARSHDWTDCPYAHPGEKARRRDPRKFNYSGFSCPDFRRGTCKKGDSCEFAHGVFKCWLHLTRDRTQPCKDGTGCQRRVYFFAHTPDQLRQTPTPRENGSADMDYFGSPIPYLMDYVSSPTSTLASPSESPPTSPVTELTSSVRNLQLGKAKMGTACSRGIPIGSPRSSMLRPGSPSTPTRPGLEEEPAMERVESRRDLRARMYAKLSKENSLDPFDHTGSGPDVAWVSELVGY